jgi:RNA polymerase sigma-70 factor, ECF subfamily
LHEQHASALWSYALRLTGDRVRAQDVVHETLLRAWRNPQILDPECGSQRSWLYTVARNIVIDEWRTTRRGSEIVTDRLPDQPIGDASEQAVNRHLVAAALGRLTHPGRAARALLSRQLGCTGRACTGDRAGTVKSRSYYALRALRLAIEELGGVE